MSITLHGVDERSAVYLAYDAQCAMASWGIEHPEKTAFTLYSANGVALMGRVVPGQTPEQITAPHITFEPRSTPA